MTYEICGECLHAKSNHESHNGHFQYCGVCFRLCENEEFNKVHPSSKIVISDLVVYNLNVMEKDNND